MNLCNSFTELSVGPVNTTLVLQADTLDKLHVHIQSTPENGQYCTPNQNGPMSINSKSMDWYATPSAVPVTYGSTLTCTDLKIITCSPGQVARLVGASSRAPKGRGRNLSVRARTSVAGTIPGQGVYRRQLIDISLSLSLPPFLSSKINKHILR